MDISEVKISEVEVKDLKGVAKYVNEFLIDWQVFEDLHDFIMPLVAQWLDKVKYELFKTTVNIINIVINNC